MKFAIRDDDTNYFTDPRVIERNYKRVWDKCPVSLSVIPFHACTKSGSIPSQYWKGEDIFPLGKNKELVVFLKDKIKENRISITLHGYSHKDHPDKYEFDVDEDLYQKVKQGKEYLEKTLDVTIKTFVPPHNSISKEGLKAVINNNLNIVTAPSFGFRKRPLTVRNVVPFIKKAYYFVKYRNKYPYTFDFGDHKAVNYFSLTPQINIEQLKSNFEYCHKMDGIFCLATHYWEFTAKQIYDNNLQMGEVFYEFLENVNQYDNINFVAVDELFKS